MSETLHSGDANKRRALTEQAWYPSRVGDRLIITTEATEQDPCWTETYEVSHDTEHGRLLLHTDHTAAEQDLEMTGWFVGPPKAPGSDPFEAPWTVAGPDRLTIIRCGRVIHQGHNAAVDGEAGTGGE
ncbi:hypothetical protein [Streptomyces sp. NPDC086787]|uniref:hypothetical protein n=1 Tax=Streptomyces sp. NPDC086787 TaxID=3365759 RepID=UPI003827F450